MNSKTTFFIVSILSFVLLANVSTVFATGGLDDEEEEEAIEELQNSITEINNSLDAINLNLEAGPNAIQANCPSTEEVVQEVVENITQEEQPSCPFAPVQNVTEPEPEQPPTTVIPPVQNLTCPFAPQPETNVTEVIEEVIENVTGQEPTCNIPLQEIIPGIVLPNVTEPIVEEPVQNNVTEPDIPICPFTGEPIQQQQPTVAPTEEEQAPVQDEQEVATIEFEASCGCFVIDKSPEEVTSNGGSNNSEESVEQALSNLGN